MITKKIYKLSQNAGIERTLEYNLCESTTEDGKAYGIEVVLTSSKVNERVKIENISNDKDVVLKLLTYLYENAVDTIHFKDIVEDYISSL